MKCKYHQESHFYNDCIVASSKKYNVILILVLVLSGLSFVVQPTEASSEVQLSSQNKQKKNLRKITGLISDDKGNPLPGASIWIKNTSSGTFSDANGHYVLKVGDNTDMLFFSFIGYVKKEIPIGDKIVINATLSNSKANTLDDVVVVAFGKQKKASVIGAISSVDVKDLKIPTSKISNVLAGQLAGIISTTSSGRPGDGTKFFIRGFSSFASSNDPLVLVDGVERSIDLVDPEDIAQFSILKDATATAVYGVRGANGVVLITTKHGTEGKPKIHIKAEHGILGPTKFPKFVDAEQWGLLSNEGGNPNHHFSDEELRMYKYHTKPDQYPNENWIKNIYNNWTQNSRVNISFSGGGSMVRYYVGGSIYDEGSIYKENKHATNYNSSLHYTKADFRSNVDMNLTPTTELTVGISTVFERMNKPSDDASLWPTTFEVSPNAFPKIFSNGQLAGPIFEGAKNPYNVLTYSGYAHDYYNNAQSQVTLNQKLDMITKGLSANVMFSYDALTSNSQNWQANPSTFMFSHYDNKGNLV